MLETVSSTLQEAKCFCCSIYKSNRRWNNGSGVIGHDDAKDGHISFNTNLAGRYREAILELTSSKDAAMILESSTELEV